MSPGAAGLGGHRVLMHAQILPVKEANPSSLNDLGLICVPPVFPAIAGSSVAKGSRNDHLSLVVNGVSGSAMQAFGKQLDAVQLASVVHYQRNAFGNDVGDVSQPQDVINLSKGQQNNTHSEFFSIIL